MSKVTGKLHSIGRQGSRLRAGVDEMSARVVLLLDSERESSMKRIIRIASVAVACISLAGGASGTACADGAPGSDSAASSRDRAFVGFISNVNLSEISAGSDAEVNATTQCVKQVGRVLVENHTALEAQLKPLAANLGIQLPNGPTQADQMMFAPIKAKAHTPGYDKAWLEMMFVGHKQALAKIDQEVASAQDEQVGAYARMARPVIQYHLDLVYGAKCHEPRAASNIPAGESGQVAGAAGSFPGNVALTAAEALASVTAVGGALMFLRRRRGCTK
ncbi:DUF4142 domain-containing protein [Streptomyces mirabilis]|uniref:DUF4142 domain-containing protein n=1 Tax=Streptomyces mirabilis TaxID=68239 RepID=UPI0036D8CEAC